MDPPATEPQCCSDGAATEQEEEAEHGDESNGLERRDDTPHHLVHNGQSHEARPPYQPARRPRRRRYVRGHCLRPPHHR